MWPWSVPWTRPWMPWGCAPWPCSTSMGGTIDGPAEDVQAMPRVRCGGLSEDHQHHAAGALPQSLVRMHGMRGPHPLGISRGAWPLGEDPRNKPARNPSPFLPLTPRPMLRFRQNWRRSRDPHIRDQHLFDPP
nr:MAG TPA: hypothetical protein [Caudoviricetes sp.]